MDIIMILSFEEMVPKCPQKFSLIALLNNILFTESEEGFFTILSTDAKSGHMKTSGLE